MGGGQLVCPLCAALSRAVGAGRPARRQACQHSLPPAQQKAVPIGLKRKSVCKILKKYDKAFIFTKIFAKLQKFYEESNHLKNFAYIFREHFAIFRYFRRKLGFWRQFERENFSLKPQPYPGCAVLELLPRKSDPASGRMTVGGSSSRGPITTRRHIFVAELTRRSLFARLAVTRNCSSPQLGSRAIAVGRARCSTTTRLLRTRPSARELAVRLSSQRRRSLPRLQSSTALRSWSRPKRS